MISRYIAKYTDIIINNLSPVYIKFPQTGPEIQRTKADFRIKYNVPGTLGVIDGTHVAVSALKHDIEHAYVNRKGFHSINVQIVCDSRMIITNINARYPGSTHDSYIFGGSELYAFLENLYLQNPNEFNFLLGMSNVKASKFSFLNSKMFFSKGDSGYALLPFLMNVVEGDNLTMPEINYNRIILSVRHLIERTIGVLKMRFRSILGERQLRYHQTKVSKIIYTCATLHNFLIMNGFDIMHDIDPNELRAVINNVRAMPANVPVNRNLGLIRTNQLIQWFMQNRPPRNH